MRYRLRTLLSSNRWLRFSLRTLFLLTLLVAVGLGVQMKRLRDRKAAVHAIEAAGGTMGFAYLGPDWLRNLIKDDKCFWDPIGLTLGPHARQAGQEEPTLDDARLARLSPFLEQFNHLDALNISRTTITD